MPPNPPPAEADDLEALFNDYTSLDETRLLSARGIPRLRERARTLRLKGKGHEYGDAERLLGLYQMWLDDLYPKAKFGDALRMVEGVGHKKTVAGEGDGEGVGRPQGEMQRQGTERIAPIFTDLASRAAERGETPGADVPDDDPDAIAELYGASPRRAAAVAKPVARGQGQTSIFGPGAVVPLPGAAAEEEEGDDLAALLAEEGGWMSIRLPAQRPWRTKRRR
ncbi:hypothetical protein GMDG_00917 [Pseudogymnoascus destructans 20631-21]|uniref:Chromosome segregation in meiosis protein n=1 Tax=Pseudogymnoascus destructans (strain ATCC MYA-4855 / 20631-21) TaxID=658429 RepID=L8FLK2_PSED2|nr:hypothetical protein GMDG_00917 [Pseudogymnoascus destructans 20631-21]